MGPMDNDMTVQFEETDASFSQGFIAFATEGTT